MMDKLENMIQLMNESLAEAMFYSNEVQTLLKNRKTKTKQHNECKQKKKKKSPPQKT